MTIKAKPDALGVVVVWVVCGCGEIVVLPRALRAARAVV